MRFFFLLSTALAGLAVLIGTFGEIRLRDKLSPRDMSSFDAAVRYHLFHAVGLLAASWAIWRWETATAEAAGWFFIAGILLFSGSSYLLALTGRKWPGGVGPLGALCFVVGWGLLAWTAVQE